MDEPVLSKFSKGFTETLLDFCEAPTPGPVFVSDLERRLQERQAVLLASARPDRGRPGGVWGRFSSLFAQRGWQAAFVLLLAFLAVSLLAVGPQRVLAQVQRWLGYVPGIGFVNLAETRVLASPVETTREGVILRVEQVIAGPQRTEILISSHGFSEADLPWPNEAVESPDFSAFLLLPDGQRLELERWELNLGAGKMEFPALPAGANHLTLIVPRLPLVPAGALPEDWEVPLVLRPAAGELTDELFPQPYSPAGASASQDGITLQVLDVAQTANETAVHYQVEWTDPDWEFHFGLGSGRRPELRDDVGHIYHESPRSRGASVAVVAIPVPDASQTAPTPAALSHDDTLVFPALSLSAGQASLWVDALEFDVPAQGSLSLDLGGDPQTGDAWPLDVRLDVAGFPVRLSGARLREETVEMGGGQSERRTFLELDLDPLEEQDGFSLAGFELANPDLGLYGSAGRAFSSGALVYKGRIGLTSGVIPAGRIELQVTGATLLAHGPWEATWTIPGREPANAVPLTRLDLQSVQLPGEGLRPRLAEAFLSDRLTALKLDAAGLPQEASFVQVLPYDPAALAPNQGAPGLYLEDNWGRRYEPGRNEAVIRPDGDEAGFDPRWRFFPPVEPLARRISLNIPGMEIMLPGKASFEIEVPQNAAFAPEEYTVTVIGGGGPERQETMIRWVSEPWAVDIPVEVAGYHLRFSQAQLERDERGDPPYRLLLKGELPAREQDGQHLYRLRFSQVERPDREVFHIDPALLDSGLISYPYGAAVPVESGSDRFQVTVVLDVTASNRVDLLPGRYRVGLNGVTAWVPGPWRLSWPLSGR